jgi:hypothetical protein
VWPISVIPSPSPENGAFYRETPANRALTSARARLAGAASHRRKRNQ